MKRLSSALLGGVVIAAMVLLQASTGLASPSNAQSVPAHRANSAAVRVLGNLPASVGHTAYIYADGNTCPNGIDVFEVQGGTVTNIQNLDVGCSNGTSFGVHYLLVGGGGNCLVFSDDGDAQVDSFTIDPTTGMLSSSPVSSVSVGGDPGDLAQIGATIIESNTGLSTLDTLSLGSGCTLTLEQQNSTGAQSDETIATQGSYVLTADGNSGGMFVYKLSAGGVLTQTYTTPGQISSPNGIATLGSRVYTGQVTGSPPQVQGFAISRTGLSGLSGSPVTDGNPSSSDGPAVATWSGGLVLQAETLSSGIAWYAPSPMSYGGDVTLPAGAFPSQLVVVGNNVLTSMAIGGDLEACGVSAAGLSGCRTIATLSGGSGSSVAVKS